jgi:hypothetical protein
MEHKLKLDYSKENIENIKRKYLSLLGITINSRDNGNWGEIIRVDGKLIKEVKDLRDKYCKIVSGSGSCKRVEVGGTLQISDRGNMKSLESIKKKLVGNGDTININSDSKDDILFHTHPNAYGTWNKRSPPSEYDLFTSLRLGVDGINQVNLVWDKHGVYIYYLYPSMISELKRLKSKNIRIDDISDKLIEILRFTKMGWGFFWRQDDYPQQYSSFSIYRQLLKEMGFYVDYKEFKVKKSEGKLLNDMIFIKPK